MARGFADGDQPAANLVRTRRTSPPPTSLVRIWRNSAKGMSARSRSRLRESVGGGRYRDDTVETTAGRELG
jgi:hypothetical protein